MRRRTTELRCLARRGVLVANSMIFIGASLIAVLLLIGCSNRDDVAEIEGLQTWRDIDLPEPPEEPLASELRLLIWRDYFDPEVLELFEDHYGVELKVTFFENNSDLKRRYRADPEGFDLLMPSSYVVERLVKADLVAELNKERLPNMGNVAPAFFQAEYDRELRFSVPFFFSYLGVAFNSDYLRSLPRDFKLTYISR